MALVTGGFCGGVEGFEPGVVVGCVEGFGVLPSVPVVVEGVGVGAGSCPGSMSGLLRTLATRSLTALKKAAP